MLRRAARSFGCPAVLGLVVLGVAALLPVGADSPGLTDLPGSEAADLARVDLQASRLVGFAPMQLDVSGVLLDAAGRELALPDDLQATLVLGGNFSSEHAEDEQMFSGAAGLPSDPAPRMRGSLVIRKPGTYTLRWVVNDGDRETVLSDEVRIRVL